MDEWIRKENINIKRICILIRAIVLHSDRDQTTAAVPFMSIDEGERGRKGMKKKQEQQNES